MENEFKAVASLNRNIANSLLSVILNVIIDFYFKCSSHSYQYYSEEAILYWAILSVGNIKHQTFILIYVFRVNIC